MGAVLVAHVRSRICGEIPARCEQLSCSASVRATGALSGGSGGVGPVMDGTVMDGTPQ